MNPAEEPDYLFPAIFSDFDLLKSKVNAPFLQARYVQRMRLVNKLRANMGSKLTLVISPAGYGKTTLVREWMAAVSKDSRPVAWVSLDKYDNDPLRFWSYIAAALGRIDPVIGRVGNEIVGKRDITTDYVSLNPLINAIARYPISFTLVLDDYHAIQERTIHLSLEYLIENLPNNLNLLIISRVDPPISLTRLQVRGQLYQLSARDLAFTLEETQALMTGIMALNMTHEEIVALLDLTKGWIVGLQLFAFSIKGEKNTRTILKKLTFKNRLILDYLVEEVLNQQPPLIKEFLLKTAILEELSAPLCDAVMEINNSWDFLNKIEEANLFITQLDENGIWYRYHTLFSDALRIYLSRLYPNELGKLHLNASSWLLNNGFVEKAIPHALATGDLDKAAEIIDSFANQAVLQLNISNLVGWIDLLPGELLRQHPGLFWPYAMANYHYGKLAEIEKKILVIESEIEKSNQNPVLDREKDRIRRQALAIRAAVACVSDNYHHGIELASLVLEDLRTKDPIPFGWLSHSLGYAYVLAGNPEKAIDSFRTAYQIALEHGLAIEYVYSRSELARVLKLQGHLHDAQDEYNKALSFAIDKGLKQDLIILPQSGLGQIYLEWNDLEKAENLLQPIIEYFSKNNYTILSWVYSISMCSKLAEYRLMRGDIEDAVILFRKAWKSYQDHQISSQLVPEAIIVMARIWLATKDWEAASHWANAREAYLESEAHHLTIAEQISISRIFIATGQPQKALALTSRLTTSSAPAIRLEENELSIRILEILAHYSLGNEKKAIEELISILSDTETEGYIGIFLAEGEKMGELLSKVQEKYRQNQTLLEGNYPGEKYIQKLCNAFRRNTSHTPEHGKKSPFLPNIIAPMVEALSERELEVLRLLLEGKTVKEVAKILVISSNTVKAHIKNIYQKLNVTSRREAIQRAFELNIMSY